MYNNLFSFKTQQKTDKMNIFTDIVNTIDVKLVKYGETIIKHTFDIEDL
jgi:hypothetical protein